MRRHHLIIAALGSLLLLSACTAPKTPQESAQAFWASVISDDAEGVVAHSTLTDAGQYDGFSRDWHGFEPTWGRVVIDGTEASIVAEFSAPEAPAAESRKVLTHLVQRQGQWKVDYTRTAEELRGGAFARLLGELDRLGRRLSDRLEGSSRGFSAEMERLGQQLEELSTSLGQQASEGIDRYAEEARRHIDELAESVRRALEEHQRALSERDREALTEVAASLDDSSEQLERPSLRAIADGSRSAGMARRQLETTDSHVLDSYKARWHQWGERFKADMQRLLEELSTSAGDRAEENRRDFLNTRS